MVARAMLCAMLFALSTGQKTGIAVMGGLFIVFSLASSFVAPRYNANFPGRSLRWYLVVCVAFFVAMIATIILVAKEPATEEAAASNEAAGAQTTETAPAAPTGDAAAGKAIFTSAGCGACHTFTPAGTNATVGPDLDKLADYAAKANMGTVEEFTHESIVDPGKYVEPGFPKGVMPPNYGTQLTAKQQDDLVAFLTAK
jgi:mono/diheme cytochrome c family protein